MYLICIYSKNHNILSKTILNVIFIIVIIIMPGAEIWFIISLLLRVSNSLL